MSKIYIEVGHDKNDTGAVASGLIERQLNLIAALACKDFLERFGFTVKMSRYDNNTVKDLNMCIIEANEWQADYYIAVHHNACDGKQDGYELIHSIYGGKGKELCEAIAKQFDKLGQNCHRVFSWESTQNPGRDYLGAIRDTNMPACVSEFAYLDSKDYLAVDTQAELIAEGEAIAKGIMDFLKMSYLPKSTVQTPPPALKVIYSGKEIVCNARIENNVTFCQLRLLAEALGKKVKYDEFFKAVMISD